MAKDVAVRLLTWSVLFLAIAGKARAADDCAASFRTIGDTQTGLKFAASESVPGLNASQAIEQIRKTVTDEGFDVVANHQDGVKVVMDFGPKSNGGTPKYMSRVVADETSNSVTIVTVLQPGMSADPADMQKNLCVVLASASGAGRGNVALTAPPIAPQPAAVPNRAAPPQDVNVLRPAAAFDVAAAKSALEPGNATIKGTACVKHSVEGGGGMYLAANQKILLFPDSPYLEEFVKLIHGAKRGRDRVDGDPQFLATRMEGMTNSKGEFQFAKMKAGKYYLYTEMSTAVNGARDVYNGDGITGPFIVHYYSTQYFTDHYNDVLDKFVTVGDGQTLKVTLTGHPSWKMLLQPLNNGGYAGLIGCVSL